MCISMSGLGVYAAKFWKAGELKWVSLRAFSSS
jgi:hypothetical protein